MKDKNKFEQKERYKKAPSRQKYHLYIMYRMSTKVSRTVIQMTQYDVNNHWLNKK